jgi:tRNA-specific 2-thiouridylase
MSGGVDSSVAAALLAEQGYDLVGVTLHLWDAEGDQKVGRCCAPEDRDDARRTCEHLGIPHYVMDEREAFMTEVVTPFVESNLRGSTPVPCVRCNQTVKLERLGALAERLGAAAIATGHYARLARGPTGAELLRGRDHAKDQSYFLFGVSRRILDRLIFPLGDLTKSETREHGQRLGVPNWDKPDSQELCFVPDGDVAGFIARRGGASAGRSGPIVDTSGRVLGRHAGVEGFTVGQRRGLRVGGPTPRYVLRVLPEQDTVVVGSAEDLRSGRLEAREVRWIGGRPPGPFEGQVRIRHRHQPADAVIEPTAEGFRARFAEPQRAIAPGQAAVVYSGERVLGGGFIATSRDTQHQNG